jgi:hypothetical protein
MFARAKQLNQWSLRLSQLAIVVFLIAGTCASIPALHTSHLVAKLLEHAPAVVIGLSIPCTLGCGFLLWRLNVSSGKTLALIFGVAAGLFLCGQYFGMAAWLGIPWVLKWNIAAFDKFLAEHPQTTPLIDSTAHNSSRSSSCKSTQ